ncbi:MAG: methyltransferase [Marinobacterium sp.]|nr:methyltransferase [Marinobacterium sp.]
MLTENAIGQRVDQAIEWLRERSSGDAAIAGMDKLQQRLIGKNFDYHARMYLLEALKASESIEQIQSHLDMGRNVLVMHDFKKGGATNPFLITPTAETRDAYSQFQDEFSDLIESFSAIPSSVDLLTAYFPDALVYNGSVSAKKRVQMQDQFNSDQPGTPRMMIAQGDAMREGVSIHDTTGKHPRVLIHLGMPVKPTAAIQQEGRIYRMGQASNAIFRYVTIGTNWERHAFASKIAGRAPAAENLAMGEEARGLKQAFIQAYEEADTYPAGFEGEGIGGKAADRMLANNLTPWDMAKSFYFGTKKQGSGRRARGREQSDYFATPEPVGMKMVQLADIRGGESALEPSAGHGAIARWLPEHTTNRAIELTSELSSKLALHFDGDVVTGSFEDHNIVNKYDAIVMNPPFGRGGKLAAEHVEKAMKHLRNQGRIVALVPTGPAADKQFERLLYQNEAAKDVHLVSDIQLPDVTFERAGTSIATRILVLEKQTDADQAKKLQQQNRDYSSVTDINDLFDRMESLEIKPRSIAEIVTGTGAETLSRTSKPDVAAIASAQQRAPADHWAKGPIIEHTTRRGKVIRGVIAPVSKDEAKDVDAYTFKKDDGYFIREAHLPDVITKLSDTAFSRSSQKHKGLSAEKVRAAADKLIRRLRLRGARVRVVATEKDLPAEVLEQAEEEGATGQIKAVLHGDEIFIVADRMSSTAAVEEAILHEGRRYGGRKLFGAEFTAAYNKLWTRMGGLKGLKALAQEAGIADSMAPYFQTASDLLQSAEITRSRRNEYLVDEFVAHVAGNQAYESIPTKVKRLIQEFIGALRQALRKAGFAELPNLSDADLAYLVRQAGKAATGRKATKPDFMQVTEEDQMDLFFSDLADQLEQEPAPVMERSALSRVPDDAPILETDGDGIGSAESLKEMTANARAYAKQHFAGSIVKNVESGHDIMISMGGPTEISLRVVPLSLEHGALIPITAQPGQYQ